VEWWERLAVGVGVVLAAVALARLTDGAVGRRIGSAPEAVTRYRVIRRSMVAAIVAIGAMTALLVVPQVRAVAGGILASSAVVGIVVGFAARSTLANFVAGLLIAFNQPVRIGDGVEVLGHRGTVEEVGLSYTAIRTAAGDRLLVPNERLASEAIRNSTIGSPEHLADVVVSVPASSDVARVAELLVEEAHATGLVTPGREPLASVRAVEWDRAAVGVSAWARDEATADRLAGEIRLRVHARLLALGVYPRGG
jgi:small-conductance mechanosensitive channel